MRFNDGQHIMAWKKNLALFDDVTQAINESSTIIDREEPVVSEKRKAYDDEYNPSHGYSKTIQPA